MIRLRAENERLRAEITVVKKRLPERRDAQRNSKAKRLRSSKNSKEGHRLNDLLDAIRLSRSTYYYELGRTDKVKERNADLSSEIVSIFNENRKRYGVKKGTSGASEPWLVNHKRVQRIMNQFALCGKRPRKSTIPTKGDVGKVADKLSINGISVPAASKVDNRCIAIQSALG